MAGAHVDGWGWLRWFVRWVGTLVMSARWCLGWRVGKVGKVVMFDGLVPRLVGRLVKMKMYEYISFYVKCSTVQR